jgi:alkylhydroperoxidase family enzyme
MLRVSSQVSGETIDLRAVVGTADADSGVEHGRLLIAFAEAVQGHDDEALRHSRDALRGVVSPAAFVDTCAVIAAFNVVDRIADATGIPLDPELSAISGDVREQLGLARFRSSANTPDVR